MAKKVIYHLRNIIIIFIGSFIFSIGINYFAIPNRLAEGGFTWVALLLHYYVGWSPSIVILVLNIPLLFIGYRVFGKKTFIYTLIGLCSVSLFLELTKNWQHPMSDVLLVSLFTGVLVGIGLGMIFRVGGTTGGVDIIARLFHKYLGWSIGRTMFLFDFTIIIVSLFIIGLNMAMYTLVAVFIGARVVDFVVEGLNSSKAITIISNFTPELARIITEKMDRGVTLLKGKGGYTGHEKEVLYVIVAPTELPKLKGIVLETDPYAFVVVHDAREVLGEGFSNIE